MTPPEINNLDPQDGSPKFETPSSTTNPIISQGYPNAYQTVPNSIGVLVLGILSICFCDAKLFVL